MPLLLFGWRIAENNAMGQKLWINLALAPPVVRCCADSVIDFCGAAQSCAKNDHFTAAEYYSIGGDSTHNHSTHVPVEEPFTTSLSEMEAGACNAAAVLSPHNSVAPITTGGGSNIDLGVSII